MTADGDDVWSVARELKAILEDVDRDLGIKADPDRGPTESELVIQLNNKDEVANLYLVVMSLSRVARLDRVLRRRLKDVGAKMIALHGGKIPTPVCRMVDITCPHCGQGLACPVLKGADALVKSDLICPHCLKPLNETDDEKRRRRRRWQKTTYPPRRQSYLQGPHWTSPWKT